MRQLHNQPGFRALSLFNKPLHSSAVVVFVKNCLFTTALRGVSGARVRRPGTLLLAMRVPNCIARLTSAWDELRPSRAATARKIALSPAPGGRLRSQMEASGTVPEPRSLRTPSSRKGCLASRPQLAMHLSSRAKFLDHSLPTSSSSSSARASHEPRENAVRCRAYPPNNSSAPTPLK